MSRLVVATAALVAAFGGSAAAQAPVQRGDTLRPAARTDTARRDTAQRVLVDWTPLDSIAAALAERSGYTVTRYRGDTVLFIVTADELRLLGGAAVEQAGSIVIADTIIYNDSSRAIVALGDTVVLREPGRGDDLIAQGRVTYDLATKRGIITGARTAVESGERWWVTADRAAVAVADTTIGQRQAFYGHGGTLTSCELDEPHYHFEARELKVINERFMVARPAILYIGDIPVMWLPFVFQDLRDGRRSGMLTPRVGLTDVVRNSPSYRRTVENLGYYWAISDYMDASFWIDWRSGARPTAGDPGWTRYNGEWSYRWIDRFLTGRFGTSYIDRGDGATSFNVSLQHSQQFSLDRRLNANINYASSTQVLRTNEILPTAAVSNITSALSFQDKLGPLSVSVGGTRTQYIGRGDIDQTLPSLNLSTAPIAIAPWLVWTPTASVTHRQSLNRLYGSSIPYQFIVRPEGVVDSVLTDVDAYETRGSFDTPLEILGWTWRNSFTFSNSVKDYPQLVRIVDVQDSSIVSERVFRKTFLTGIDWSTSVSLPTLLQGTWNVVPSIGISNVDAGPFLVASERTAGEFVAQRKRLVYGLSSSPTFFGLFPGFGPFTRFRHAVSPQITFNWAPRATVGDAYLRARGLTRQGYRGSDMQSSISLGLSTNIEAKLRNDADTADLSGGGQKIKLLTVSFSSLTYDFVQANETGEGLVSDRFGYTIRSDLLPGFNLGVDYSLQERSLLTNARRFDPYRERISMSFTLNRETNPFAILRRLFGKPIPATSVIETVAEGEDREEVLETATAPIAGRSRPADFSAPASDRWSLSVNFTSSRQRPVSGAQVIDLDPAIECERFRLDPPRFDQCVAIVSATPLEENPDDIQTTIGGAVFRSRPTRSLQFNTNFHFTPNWSANWGTTYDFIESEFASHQVSLQRDLHDWRAIFSFTQAPNGNFAFMFYISLKAEPDLKFDYNSRTYRRR